MRIKTHRSVYTSESPPSTTREYIWGLHQVKLGAGTWATTQLWNPEWSYITARLRRFHIFGFESDYAVTWTHYDEPLSTVVSVGKDKHFGNVGSVCQIRSEATSVRPSTPVGKEIGSIIRPYGPTNYNLRDEVIIPPGWGMCVLHDLLNKDVDVVYEWAEDT